MKNAIEILVNLSLPEDQISRLRQVSDRIQLTINPSRKAEDFSAELWKKTEILFTDGYVLPDPLKVPRLRWIHFSMAGVDRVIKTPIVQNTDIWVTNSSGVITSQVAEYAVMMLLALGHHLPRVIADQQQKTWAENRWQKFTPLELRGSTVGILGYGSIGRQVARLLQPFGVKVLATKKDVMHPEQARYVENDMGDPQGVYFHRLYPIQALHSLLKECDFVVLCLPLTPETQHIINMAALEAMKPGACLVNVGRGDLIDEDALAVALTEKKIAAAALDVFHQEPLPEDSPLWGLDNLIVSPHISGISASYQQKNVDLFIENLNAYLTGAALVNRVDVQKGY